MGVESLKYRVPLGGAFQYLHCATAFSDVHRDRMGVTCESDALHLHHMLAWVDGFNCLNGMLGETCLQGEGFYLKVRE